jgi:hypothetical protein
VLVKKKYWQWLVLLVFLIAILSLIFWRKTKLNQPISLSSEQIETTQVDLSNQFPLSPWGGEIELYAMACCFQKSTLVSPVFDRARFMTFRSPLTITRTERSVSHNLSH